MTTECKHTNVLSWTTKDGEPVPLWSCEACHRKFVPLDISAAQWAARGKWLVDKLSERTTPDGRTVLELCEEPIWIKAEGTLADYIGAVDLAMERDEG